MAVTGFVQVCSGAGVDSSCVWVNASELAAASDSLSAFNLDAFEIGVGAVLAFFAIGFGVGLIVSTIRKARTL